MYENILSANQQKMLPFLETFHREYYLVGGTAIALQLGHRESIDFDMFKHGAVHKTKIIAKLKAFGWDYHLLYTDMDSFHITVEDVKLTFFNYPNTDCYFFRQDQNAQLTPFSGDESLCLGTESQVERLCGFVLPPQSTNDTQ